MDTGKILITAFVGLALIYLGYLIFFRRFIDTSILIVIGVVVLLFVIILKTTDTIKTPEQKPGKITCVQAKKEIENHIAVYFNGKTIDYTQREDIHAGSKAYQWGHKDHYYYGIIARLTPDSNSVLGEKIRIIWSLETNQFIQQDDITIPDDDPAIASKEQKDQFYNFVPVELIGAYVRPDDRRNGGQNVIFDRDFFSQPNPKPKEEDEQ